MVSPERLDDLGATLTRRVQKQITARAAIEERWLDDLRQYHGKYDRDTETRLERDQTGASRIFVNRTGPKCRALIARLGDMLFPSDDRNWVIKATPSPELQALDPALAQELQAEAERRADGMQREIDDQLTEARYVDKARRALWDLVVLGTCVVKGPVVTARARPRWQALGGAMYGLAREIITRPDVEIVSPWDFFPDMSGRNMGEVESTFERKYLSRKDLRRLAQINDGRYNVGAIRRVLDETPLRQQRTSDDHRQQLRAITGMDSSVEDTQFCLWEYHGPLDNDDFRALGLEPSDDPLIGAEAVVEMIGNHVIRAYLHPLDTQDALYSTSNFIADESGVFGYGLPYAIRAPQIVVSATWRMILDNNAYSVGPQTAIDRKLIEPANGVYALQGKKLWYFKGDQGRSIRDCMWSFDVSSRQPELMGTYQVASQLVDEESGIPALAQGELGANPASTATATSMLMNSGNIIIREIVRDWDSNVTKPLLRRFYDYNMQYSLKE